MSRSYTGLPYPESHAYLDVINESSERDEIIDLTAANPISAPPPEVEEAFKSAPTDRQPGMSRGNGPTLARLVAFFKKRGIECNMRNVFLYSGILDTIGKIYDIKKVKEKGGVVLFPTPTFGVYFEQVDEKKIPYKTIPTTEAHRYMLDPLDLEAAIQSELKKRGDGIPIILILCYPNNPTGAVMTEENARAIAEVVKKYKNVHVIADEAFLMNRMDDYEKHFSLAAVGGDILKQTTTVTSFAKSTDCSTRTNFGITGEADAERFARKGGYNSHDQKGISTAIDIWLKEEEKYEKAVKAVAEAVAILGSDDEEYLYNPRGDEEAYKEMEALSKYQYYGDNRELYRENIKLIKERVDELNQRFSEIFGEEKTGDDAYIKAFIPDPEYGGMYLLQFEGLRDKIFNGRPMATGLDVTKWLHDSAKVGVVPGECFGFNEDKMMIRMAIGCEKDLIDLVFSLMNEAAKEIQRSPLEAGKPSSKPSPDDEKAKRLSEYLAKEGLDRLSKEYGMSKV